MKKLTLLSLLLLTSTLFFSCQEEDLSDLNYVFYVSRNGADMPAYVYGNGSEKIFIILLSGGPGSSGLQYRYGKFSEELEKRYAMVYWDQRGQGMSQGNYDKEDVTIEEMVKDVRALALVIKEKWGQDCKLFLMGHSWGGGLGSAFMVTEDYQYLFNGWIEVDGAHDYPATYRGSIKQLQDIGEQQIDLGNSIRFWNRTLDRVNQLDTNVVDFSWINQQAYEAESVLLQDGYIDYGEGGYYMRYMVSYYMEDNPITVSVTGLFTGIYLTEHGLEEFSVTDELYKIEIPTLLLWGKYDIVVSPDLGVTAYNNISSTYKELVVFDKSGHSPMDSQADEFLTEVYEFIEQHK